MVSKYAMSDSQSFIVDEVIPEGENAIAKNAEIILKRDYDFTKELLQKNMDKLHLLANALLEKETLDYDQIAEILNLKEKKP
jgi:cell division protease FtsH